MNNRLSLYLKSLIDRVYKILPLYEEQNEGLFTYIQSLIYELNGFKWIRESGIVAEYYSLLATLESLSDDAICFSKENECVIKREVFKCITIIKKIIVAYESGDETELF
ncbi:hypothetical protein B7C51_25200 (plasmid) [Paenibacillus larvae subsp. pulvifaciens]|uniref:Uncharacterized protein n=1 Tax=Paenibacillus larvae subsp. pulvifaciens TaxID=1477 RepID=A0A1V0V0U1_9BACL|nr:hypothetical protein [Paenibacillus larvae]ARF70770.1 hypothetical protein B7C51_25200 [Paenibacillus larvae subsp. pulvifaciens]